MASKWELPWPICSKPYPLSASLFYQTLSASWLMFYICRHTSELLWFGFRSGNITLKWVTQIGGFPLHMKVMFTPYCHLLRMWGFPGGTGGKETANQYRRHKRSEFNRGVGREVSGSGRSPGVESCSPFQYSCLENPMNRGVWQGTDHEDFKKSDMTELLSTLIVQQYYIFKKCTCCNWSIS